MARPTILPRWATGGGAQVTEPSEGKKDSGWTPGEAAPAQYFNWLGRYAYDWINWFDGQIGAGLVTVARTWTALQSFNAGLAVPLGQTAAIAGTASVGTLNVTGASSLNTASVMGAASVGGALGVSGAATLASLGVTGNGTVGGTLGVTGDVTGSGNVTGAKVLSSGDMEIQGYNNYLYNPVKTYHRIISALEFIPIGTTMAPTLSSSADDATINGATNWGARITLPQGATVSSAQICAKNMNAGINPVENVSFNRWRRDPADTAYSFARTALCTLQNVNFAAAPAGYQWVTVPSFTGQQFLDDDLLVINVATDADLYLKAVRVTYTLGSVQPIG